MAIGAVEWLTMARIVRSQVMLLGKQEFVMAAAEAMGVSKVGIIFNHSIPNAIGSYCLSNSYSSSNNAS